MVHKDHPLYTNASGIIRQEGIIGVKFLELIPGVAEYPLLQAGDILSTANKEPANIDVVMRQIKDIATNIQEVARSLRDVFGGATGAQRLQDVVEQFQGAVQSVNAVAQSLDHILLNNDRALSELMRDMKEIAQELKAHVPRVGDTIGQVTTQLSEKVLPALESSVGKIAERFEAATAPVQQVMEKINNGTGFLGQMVNDADTYKDVQYAVQSMKNYVSKVDSMSFSVDAHTESLRGVSDANFHDAKGYFNVWVFPEEDYFYLGGVTFSTFGKLHRTKLYREWFDADGQELFPEKLNLTDRDKLYFAPVKRQTVRSYDYPLLNIQMGKCFGNFAFRFGLFEGCAGVAVDYQFPFGTDFFKWITTFEAFDFRGRNRLNDCSPHLKWMNRIFVTRNIYGVFGADDFISKNHRSAFFGVGLAFTDDDLKYLLSK